VPQCNFRSDGSPRANICLPHLGPSFFFAFPARPHSRGQSLWLIGFFFRSNVLRPGRIRVLFRSSMCCKISLCNGGSERCCRPPRTFSSRSPLVVAARRWLHFRPFQQFRMITMSWHLHLIAWGEPREKLGNRIDRLNDKRVLLPIADGLAAAHQKRISKGKWLTKSLTFPSHRKKLIGFSSGN
jgi:hypothetical protein